MDRGQLLEFRSTEISVEEDFPAWCRMTGNELVPSCGAARNEAFSSCKGALAERPFGAPRERDGGVHSARQPVTVTVLPRFRHRPRRRPSARCR